MAIPLILMAAGTAIQAFGQMSANAAQAVAEAQNSKFYDQQAEYARLSQMRAEQISEVDYTMKLSAQSSAYAGGGVDSSGSAAVTMGATLKQAIDDVWAIKQKGDLDVKLARMRSVNSADNAKMLSSTGYNAVQVGTTVLSAYGATEGYGKGFSSLLSSGTPPSAQGAPAKYFPSASKKGA